MKTICACLIVSVYNAVSPLTYILTCIPHPPGCQILKIHSKSRTKVSSTKWRKKTYSLSPGGGCSWWEASADFWCPSFQCSLVLFPPIPSATSTRCTTNPANLTFVSMLTKSPKAAMDAVGAAPSPPENMLKEESVVVMVVTLLVSEWIPVATDALQKVPKVVPEAPEAVERRRTTDLRRSHRKRERCSPVR